MCYLDTFASLQLYIAVTFDPTITEFTNEVSIFFKLLSFDNLCEEHLNIFEEYNQLITCSVDHDGVYRSTTALLDLFNIFNINLIYF